MARGRETRQERRVAVRLAKEVRGEEALLNARVGSPFSNYTPPQRP